MTADKLTSSNKNILSFEIKAGIFESIESDIEFQIQMKNPSSKNLMEKMI